MFLHDKLDLDKFSIIIQKYCCQKMTNQNITFFCVMLDQWLDDNVPFEY
jgi:hypothetical protein